ncbi:MAG: phosphatase 2C-like domain-containing protein [Monoraphidium minutum]|nr:MAG: phosphatase 2C-like domain-containing protein [Monoraphidium minutum]
MAMRTPRLLLGCHVYTSEGRDARVVARLRELCAAQPGVLLAASFVDAPYHRSSLTLVGRSADALASAVVTVAEAALAAVDLRAHDATHPRLGAVDHISCHPVPPGGGAASSGAASSGGGSREDRATLESTASTSGGGGGGGGGAPLAAAAALARSIGGRLSGGGAAMPVYYYGAAHPQGRRLAEIRRQMGYFGSDDPSRHSWRGTLGGGGDLSAYPPDAGPLAADPRKGVITIGAAPWIINYNVPVAAADMGAARRVARAVSERGGGLRGVEAMALAHSPGTIEVACNLLDPEASPPEAVRAAVEAAAAAEGLALAAGAPPYVIGKLPGDIYAAADALLPFGAHGASRVAAALEPPTATLRQRQQQQHQPATAAVAAAAPEARAAARAEVMVASVAAWQIGLGSATANGLHEKNEDAAVLARLLRPDPSAGSTDGCGGGGAGGGGGLDVLLSLAGAGLKNDDPPGRPVVNNPRAPLSARALQRAAEVRVFGLEAPTCGGGGGPALVAHLAGVMDGHGGRGTSKWAARRLPLLVAEALQRDPSLNLTAALTGALRGFDRWWSNAMHDPDISRYGHDDSGSTAMLAAVAPRPPADGGGWRLAVANLGDGAALLLAPGGGVTQLSETHNTGNPAELERLIAAGAQVVTPLPGGGGDDGGGGGGGGGHARFFTRGPIWGKVGLKVSRALGDVQFKRPVPLVSTDPHCTELHLPPGAGGGLLLLLSDGVTDVLADHEIAELALAAIADADSGGGGSGGDSSGGDSSGGRAGGQHDEHAKAVAAAVVAAAAHDAGAHDNMTCACVVFGGCGEQG